MKYILGFITGFMFLAVIVLVLYGLNTYKLIPKEQANPTAVPNAPGQTNYNATVTPALSVSPTVMIPTTSPAKDGSSNSVVKITGALGYPSSFVPAMKVCLYEYTDPEMIQGPKYCTFTKDNQMTYVVSGEVKPSKYVVFAWPASAEQGSELTGSYTPAVACGLNVDCKDHAPIPLDMVTEKTISGIDIRDWYAEQGTFPPKPVEDGTLL